MKKYTDKEIQELLDKNGEAELKPTDDVQLYKKMYTALNEKPLFQLSHNFANNIVETIKTKEVAKTEREEKLWLVIGFLGILALVVAGLVWMSHLISADMSKYIYASVIGTTLIFAVQWVDRKVKRLYLS